jgi:hypothetical protein
VQIEKDRERLEDEIVQRQMELRHLANQRTNPLLRKEFICGRSSFFLLLPFRGIHILPLVMRDRPLTRAVLFLEPAELRAGVPQTNSSIRAAGDQHSSIG